MQAFTTQLLPSRASNLGILQLNNPSSLNALTIEMIRALKSTISHWQESGDGTRATLMIGAPLEKDDGTKKNSFCAGGDVKSLYLSVVGKGPNSSDGGGDSSSAPTLAVHGRGTRSCVTADFFREEYELNHMIATQSPDMPQVSIWDGVVMGGGVGVSVHGKYRVATENTLFAMPETVIGLFPDVGSNYWIPRLKVGRGVGNYLALTGARLKADDLIYAGIATHYVSSKRLDELRAALIDSTKEAGPGDCTAGFLMSYHEHANAPEQSYLARHRGEIDAAFNGKDSVEEIVVALEGMGTSSKFGQQTLATLKKASPTSLKITLESLQRGAALKDVGQVLEMEFRVMQACMREGSDFYEGIRAALVDKCRSPQWSPKTLEEVSEETVDSYFESLGENDLWVSDTTSNDAIASKL